MVKRTAQKKASVKLKKSPVKQAKRVRKFFVALSVSFCAVIFLTGYILTNYLNRNLAVAFTPSTTTSMSTGYPTVLYGVFDDGLRFTKLQFIIFDIDGKKLIKYSIPVEKELDAPGRVGDEKVKNFFEIGTLNSITPAATYKDGFSYLNKSMLKVFGIPAERYVFVNKSTETFWDTFWQTGNIYNFVNVNNIKSFSANTKANFSFKEIAQLSRFISGLPADRLISNDYFGTYMDNIDTLDKEIRDIMLLSLISQEGRSVAILNGADVEGLATFGARVVKNLGGRVIAVTNTDIQHEKSYIITDLFDSKTVAKLATTFGITNVISKADAKSIFVDAEIDRSDIVLILGFDLANSL